MNMARYYGQLVGCKIVNFKFEDDEYAMSPFPVFTLERADGGRVILSLSMDEEANGGGFGFIEEAMKND